jgi:topoisomerase-4 subunit A
LKLLKRKVVDDDVARLTEIKIKRISKYNAFKADDYIKGIEGDIEDVKANLAQLTRYAIRYFKELKKKYGEGRERRTEISSFEKIVAKKVVIANDTLYLNAKDGMAGWGIKRDSVTVEKCSRMDDIIVFGKDGTMQVRKISDKAFVGKNPSHLAVFRRDDLRYYCMVYRDGRDGRAMAKRFTVSGVTREKMYDLTKGTKGSRVLFFSVHKSEEEAVPKVVVHLKPALRLRNVEIELDFAEVAVKGRGANGLTVTKNPVSKVVRAKV